MPIIDEPQESAVPNVAATASPDIQFPVDDATPEQLVKGSEIIELLKGNTLTIHVAVNGGELEEMPIGRALDVLSQRGAITPRMAIILKTIYEVTLTDLGQTDEQVAQGCKRTAEQEPVGAEHADFRSIIDAIQRGARTNLPHKPDEQPTKNPGYGTFSYYIQVRDGEDPIKLSIIEAIALLKYKNRLTDLQAKHLLSACKDSMIRTPHRRRSVKQRLVPKELAEIEEELKRLEEKATDLIAWIVSLEKEQPEVRLVSSALDDHEPAPELHADQPQPQPQPDDEIFAGNPELARTRRGGRLAIIVAGIVLAGGVITVCTNPSGRNAKSNRAATTVSAMDGSARHAGEAEAEAPAPVLPPQAAAATLGPQTAAPAGELIPLAQPLSPTETPATITIPIIIKSSSGGDVKIDANASRATWEALGYKVGISMGLNGKIIKLTDTHGNVYLVNTTNLASGATESTATLQSGE